MSTSNQLAVAIFFSLAFCMSSKSANAFSPSKNHKMQSGAISSWEIRGALAAKSKNKSWTAHLYWLQSGPNHYQIRLIGPLASASILIKKDNSIVTIQDGHKKITTSKPEDFLLKQSGMRLPVENLYYWIRGLPAPGALQSKIYNKVKLLQELKQKGFTINFNQYALVNGIFLPTQISLVGRNVKVKLIINSWILKT